MTVIVQRRGHQFYVRVWRVSLMLTFLSPKPGASSNVWRLLESDPAFREGMARAAGEHERGEFDTFRHK